MKRLKVAMVVNSINYDGVSRVVLNYCKVLDLTQVELVVLSGSPVIKGLLEGIPRECKIIELGDRKKRPIRYYKRMYDELRDGQFDITHLHCNSHTVIIEMFLSKITGVKKIITHCHTSSGNHKIMHYILTPLFNCFNPVRVSCSDLSSKWMYGNYKSKVLKNGIIISDFAYDNVSMKNIRKNLAIPDDAFVIGHVGGFTENKNQVYLVDILEELLKDNKSYYLVLIGDGVEKSNVVKHCIEKNVISHVRFVEANNYINKYYSVFDCFCLPSYYEGLPLTSIEAQASGLKCILSNGVSKEASVSFGVSFADINDIDLWINKIRKLEKDRNRMKSSEKNSELIKKNGFSVEMVANEIMHMYQM